MKIKVDIWLKTDKTQFIPCNLIFSVQHTVNILRNETCLKHLSVLGTFSSSDCSNKSFQRSSDVGFSL